MVFLKINIDGAYIIEHEKHQDERGYFARTFCTRSFSEAGLESQFVQHSASFNKTRGTLRGMHYQSEPCAEVKLVRCARGSIYDVILDLRPQSPTFKQWQGVTLDEDSGRQLYIPKGCAHGFQTQTDDVEVHYLISDPYAPEFASGLRFDDEAFGISWPLDVAVISERDLAWPKFTERVADTVAGH